MLLSIKERKHVIEKVVSNKNKLKIVCLKTLWLYSNLIDSWSSCKVLLGTLPNNMASQ